MTWQNVAGVGQTQPNLSIEHRPLLCTLREPSDGDCNSLSAWCWEQQRQLIGLANVHCGRAALGAHHHEVGHHDEPGRVADRLQDVVPHVVPKRPVPRNLPPAPAPQPRILVPSKRATQPYNGRPTQLSEPENPPATAAAYGCASAKSACQHRRTRPVKSLQQETISYFTPGECSCSHVREHRARTDTEK